MTAYITVNTKNNKKGETFVATVANVEDALAWVIENQEALNSIKAKRNVKDLTLTVINRPEVVFTQNF